MQWPTPGSGGPAAGQSAGGAPRRLAEAIFLTAILLGVLAALTLGLWNAEERLDDAARTRAPTYVLWGGLTISVLMSGAVFQTLLNRARAQEVMRKQLEAIESLHAICLAIGAQIKEGTALDALASAAQRMLRMDRAVIAMLNESQTALHVVAGGGAVPPDFPRTFALTALPASSHCLATDSSIYEGDTRGAARPFGMQAVKAFEAASLILIPLRLNHKPIGLLTLSSSKPREFSDLDRRIGELLGAQASVVLANQQLYQQTRDDAETKTVLLRELNHRVKNNLAGIVALLEFRPPSMPAEVEQWLDRATQRIRSMANAHQLFTAGARRVPLDTLVAGALAASTVNKPANVVVQTDLNGARRTIDPERAVALAMVLNELCYNALVHGLVRGGTLTIRARGGTEAATHEVSANNVVIEVTDSGWGGRESRVEPDRAGEQGIADASVLRSGEGLVLVEGLVRRELKGSFALHSSAAGGTTAIMEFPLPSEEQ